MSHFKISLPENSYGSCHDKNVLKITKPQHLVISVFNKNNTLMMNQNELNLDKTGKGYFPSAKEKLNERVRAWGTRAGCAALTVIVMGAWVVSRFGNEYK